jgi:4-oxalocrotonate tautomerase
MPTIFVEGPPLKKIEKKRKLVRGLTDIAVEVYGIGHISVIIKENPPENVGANGQLILDRKGK